jgi:hypothetical protein
MRLAAMFFGALALTAATLVSACGESPTKSSPAVASLTIDGARSLVEGETLTLTATAHLSNGAAEPVSTGLTWVSDDPRVATIDARGVVTAVSAGQSQIRATFSSVSATTAVRVTAAPRSVSGKVHESFPTESVAVAGATVSAVGADGATASATTDASGAFTMRLVPGAARLTVAAAGYETSSTSAEVTAGDLSLSLVPVLREVTESFDYVYPRPSQFINARTFRFNVHRAGSLNARFTQSYELASAQASTCIEVRDSGNRVLAHADGQYDNPAGPIELAVVPGIYTVVFSSCNQWGYANWHPETMAAWGGAVKHPN